MRTLFDILEGAKNGNKPTHDECYYAMLALDVLCHFDKMSLMGIYQAAQDKKPSLELRACMEYPESFKRSKRAYEKSPQDWLGNNVPDNPEYQIIRKLAFKVAEKATGLNLNA